MNLTLKKELPIIGIVLLPFIYLAFIWKSLPDIVPMHWNSKGEIDDWGSKYSLLVMLFLLPVLTYAILLLVPKIDPKMKIEMMGAKFYQIKFVLVFFMSVLAIFILYSTNNQSISNPNVILSLVGMLLIVLGNYFKVIKQNYFIGIKTPWTLENEEVWKMTHKFAGKLWVVGGFLISIFCWIIPNEFVLYLLLSVVAIIVIVPIAYSYIKFKELKKK